MKKIVIILSLLLSLGTLVSCSSEGQKTSIKNIADGTEIELTTEEKKQINEINEQAIKIEEEVNNTIEKIKNDEGFQEKEFDQNCNYEFIDKCEYIDSSNIKYIPIIRICTKCNGSTILEMIEKEENIETFDEVSEELKKL